MQQPHKQSAKWTRWANKMPKTFRPWWKTTSRRRRKHKTRRIARLIRRRNKRQKAVLDKTLLKNVIEAQSAVLYYSVETTMSVKGLQLFRAIQWYNKEVRHITHKLSDRDAIQESLGWRRYFREHDDSVLYLLALFGKLYSA